MSARCEYTAYEVPHDGPTELGHPFVPATVTEWARAEMAAIREAHRRDSCRDLEVLLQRAVAIPPKVAPVACRWYLRGNHRDRPDGQAPDVPGP